MKTRWLVIYYDGDSTKAAIIEDDDADGTVSMPFGVQPEQVADDCVDITAIIQLWDDASNLPYVVIDDKQFSFDPADPAVVTEEGPDEERQDESDDR